MGLECDQIESKNKTFSFNSEELIRMSSLADDNDMPNSVIDSCGGIVQAIIHNEGKNEDFDEIEKKIEMQHNEDKNQWRRMYLGRSFYLVSYVIYVSLAFLLFSAIGLFTISENVLIALLTSMVVNVLGVLAIAFHWLYQK